MNVYLLEMNCLDPDNNPVTIGVSTQQGGYSPLPGDNAPVPFYPPALNTPPNYKAQAFQNGLEGGCSTGDMGTATIENGQGEYDQYFNYAFDGQLMRLLMGEEGAPYADFVPILSGTMCQPMFIYQYMQVQVRDYMEFFDQAISQYVYLGNNVAGAGVEGTPDDIGGKSKPLGLGIVRNSSWAWVSQSYMIGQVHNGPILSVNPNAGDGLYANGIPYPLDTSVNGSVESASATYVSALSLSLTGVNRTSTYVAGLLLTITYTVSDDTNVGNLVVVGSAVSGSNTVLTLAQVANQAYAFTLPSGCTINKISYGGGDCPNLASLEAASPADGTYCTGLFGGYVKAAGGASAQITVDYHGDNTGGVFSCTVADIIKCAILNYSRRKRTNIVLKSELFSDPSWVLTGLTPGAQVQSGANAGMWFLTETTASGNHSLAQTQNLGTGMFCFSIPVMPGTRTLCRLRLYNPATPANNCQVDFDLAAMQVLQILANGNAVGPQYTSTGFITNGGIIADPSGALRLWVAGQPDQSFTQLGYELELLSGTDANYTDTYAGDGQSGLWVGAPKLGAQLETYSSPSAYTGPTLTTPVIGYDPVLAPTIDPLSFAAMNTAAPYAVGFQVNTGDSTTVLQLMQAMCDSALAWCTTNRAGQVTIGQLAVPSQTATALHYFTSEDIVDDSLDKLPPFENKNGAPAKSVSLTYQHNNTVQAKSSLPSSMWQSNPYRVSWLGQEWRTMSQQANWMLARDPLACDLSFTTYIDSPAAALNECKRRFAIYSGALMRLTFKCYMDALTPTQRANLNIGSIVNVQYSRFGLENGRNFLVLFIEESHQDNDITLEVLG